MASLSTRIRAVSDRAQDAMANMSPRDRMLGLVTVVVVTLAVVVGGMLWMHSTISNQKSRVADRTDTLHLIKAMAADYQDNSAKAAAIEDLLRKHSNTDLSSFLEQAAGRANIGDRLSAVREKSTGSDEMLEEKVYSVSISRVTVEEMSSFLYEVESTDYPLRILSFKAKSRKRGDEKLLDLDMDVASYRLVGDTDDGSEG